MHVLEMLRLKKFVANRRVGLALMAGLIVTIGKTVSAAPLPPGSTITPDGNGLGMISSDTLVTQIPSSVGYASVSAGPGKVYDLQFQIETSVYETPSDTFDFVYQLYNTSPNNNSTIYGDTVQTMTIQSFAGYTLKSDDYYIASTQAPLSINRSLDGSVVGFNFYSNTQSSEMIPGASSDYLIVTTNATAWSLGTASVAGGLAGETTVQVPYGLVSPVPEPTSLGLASVAGLSLLGRRRRAAR